MKTVAALLSMTAVASAQFYGNTGFYGNQWGNTGLYGNSGLYGNQFGNTWNWGNTATTPTATAAAGTTATTNTWSAPVYGNQFYGNQWGNTGLYGFGNQWGNTGLYGNQFGNTWNWGNTATTTGATPAPTAAPTTPTWNFPQGPVPTSYGGLYGYGTGYGAGNWATATNLNSGLYNGMTLNNFGNNLAYGGIMNTGKSLFNLPQEKGFTPDSRYYNIPVGTIEPRGVVRSLPVNSYFGTLGEYTLGSNNGNSFELNANGQRILDDVNSAYKPALERLQQNPATNGIFTFLTTAANSFIPNDRN